MKFKYLIALLLFAGCKSADVQSLKKENDQLRAEIAELKKDKTSEGSKRPDSDYEREISQLKELLEQEKANAQNSISEAEKAKKEAENLAAAAERRALTAESMGDGDCQSSIEALEDEVKSVKAELESCRDEAKKALEKE